MLKNCYASANLVILMIKITLELYLLLVLVAPDYFTLDGKAPPSTRSSNEVERVHNRLCYPHTGFDGINWRSSSSPSLWVELSIDAAQTTPQGIRFGWPGRDHSIEMECYIRGFLG